MTARVALATAGGYAHLDEDLPQIVDAASERGAETVIADWHDATVDWRSVDVAVIRSTWDYTSHLTEFLDWCRRVSSQTLLANPLPAVVWNCDKSYLADLASLDLPVVPTRYFRPGDPIEADFSGEVVIKPVVSAGGKDTERYGPARSVETRAHIESLLASGRTAMLQPYLASVDVRGETSLVYFGDRFSHSFEKGPILTPDSAFVEGLYREETITKREPTASEREVAEMTLDALSPEIGGCTRSDLLYARVDLAEDETGNPVILELELIEPSFFCSHQPGSAERFIDALLAHIQTAAEGASPSHIRR